MAKQDREGARNVGLSVTNTGSGTGFHAEARGVGTTGAKVSVNLGGGLWWCQWFCAAAVGATSSTPAAIKYLTRHPPKKKARRVVLGACRPSLGGNYLTPVAA